MTTITKRIALAVTASAALAPPGVAAAAPPSLFSAGGKKVRKYELSLNVLKDKTAQVSVSLLRAKGTSLQSYSLLAAKGVKYSAKANLSSASVKAPFGSRGKVSMTFRATGKTSNALPKGCKGKPGAVRKGVLTGTLKLRFDSRFFRTVRRSSQTAFLVKGGSELTCRSVTSVAKDKLSLSAFPAGNTPTGTSFFVSKSAKGKVTESASSFSVDKASGVSASRFISATGRSSAFTAATNLTSAKATGIGPFLGGTLAFTAGGAPAGKFASGTVAGSFLAKFDSGGRARLTTGMVGTLSTR